MKTKKPSPRLPCSGVAVYRPDGTVQNAFPQSEPVTADQSARLIAWAYHDDCKDADRASYVTLPKDADAGKRAGYRVGRVTITPL